MLAISCESREMVDAMNAAAAANGGTADVNPRQDLGFAVELSARSIHHRMVHNLASRR